MSQINFQLDKKQAKQFGNLIEEMSQVTKRETKTVVRNLGRDFAKAAINFTPIAPSTKIISVFRIRWRKESNKGQKYIVPAKYIRGKPKTIKIRARGYAKYGWSKAMFGLGLTPLTKFVSKKDVGIFEDGLKMSVPYVEIGNRVPYIGDLDRGTSKVAANHILSKSILKVQIQMEVTLTRMAERMRRTWER